MTSASLAPADPSLAIPFRGVVVREFVHDGGHLLGRPATGLDPLAA